MNRYTKSNKVLFKAEKEGQDYDSSGQSGLSYKEKYTVDGEMNDEDNDEEYHEDEEDIYEEEGGEIVEEDEEEEGAEAGEDKSDEEGKVNKEGKRNIGGRQENDAMDVSTDRSEYGKAENSHFKNLENISIKPHSTRGRPPKRKFGRSSSPDSKNASTSSIPSNSKRPRLPYPVDEKGSPLFVLNDEYMLPDDPEGETKINKYGDLLGGRQFLVRTFTLNSRGKVKYMLSTEPARSVGFRDSYLFFQYHPNLYKLVISQEDRNYLIDRGVIPYSYRSRAIALVTARSVFKEFGAKIVVDGKNITDDYYSTTLRKEGKVTEGTYAREPHSKISGKGDCIDFTIPSVNPAKNAVEFFDKKNHNIAPGSNITATNWLYQHAAACSRLNSDLFYDRERVLLIQNLGLRDPYTNTLHIPQSTQPTKVLKFSRLNNNTEDIVYETLLTEKDVTRRKTGLINVSPEIFEGIVSEDLKQAILEQQDFEKDLD